MKFLKLLSFFLVVGMLAVSCKGDGADSSSATDTSAVPAAATTTSTTTPPAKAEPEVPAGPLTTLAFDDTTYDFGEVMEGEKVVYEYAFKNTGTEPLIISNAKGSCGCTVPQWPKEPIPPGESSSIKVQFDSKGKGKVGGNVQSKRVTITANTDPVNTYLTIKGTVNKEEGAEPAAAPGTITVPGQ